MKSHFHLLHTRSHCVVYRYSVIGQYFYEYLHIVLCLFSFLYFVFVLYPNGIESYNCFVCYHGPSFFFSADDSKPVSWPITSGVMLLFINVRLEAKGKWEFSKQTKNNLSPVIPSQFTQTQSFKSITTILSLISSVSFIVTLPPSLPSFES